MGKQNRTEPREPTVKALFAMGDNHCSYIGGVGSHPTCEALLTDPAWKRVKARICHIEGERPGAARYRADMTDEERRHFDNLILLCPSCHTIIDDLEPDLHTVEVLRDMKERRMRADRPKWYGTDERLQEVVRATIAEYRAEASASNASEAERPPAWDLFEVILDYSNMPHNVEMKARNVSPYRLANPHLALVWSREDPEWACNIGLDFLYPGKEKRFAEIYPQVLANKTPQPFPFEIKFEVQGWVEEFTAPYTISVYRQDTVDSALPEWTLKIDQVRGRRYR